MTGLRVSVRRMRVAVRGRVYGGRGGGVGGAGANANLVYWANYSDNTISFRRPERGWVAGDSEHPAETSSMARAASCFDPAAGEDLLG